MPKDPTKNVDRYKVRGGELNEFDFHQNQEEFAEQPKGQAANLIPGTPPEARTAGQATRKTSKAATKGTKNTKEKKKAPTRSSAKKPAARKAATKKKASKKK